MAYRMTPARRAALRKAQLASARKRRKRGVKSAVKKSFSQSRQRGKANRSLRKARFKSKVKKFQKRRRNRIASVKKRGY